jgi:hypothetical protein
MRKEWTARIAVQVGRHDTSGGRGYEHINYTLTCTTLARTYNDQHCPVHVSRTLYVPLSDS